MNPLIAAMENSQNKILTQNGAETYASTMNYLYDFYALGGALRSRPDDAVLSLFTKAFSDSPLFAMKCLFYFRDIRGGQGERKIFRTIIKHLASAQTDIMRNLFKFIPEYGRWDDMFEFFGTPLETDMKRFVREQLDKDIFSDNPSLLGKWLPSINTSSEDTRQMAKRFRIALGYTSKEYRKVLSALRKKIAIVESFMSAKKWSEINYSRVTSKASMIYRTAFYKNDFDRYTQYIENVSNGKEKINSSTTYPYEIVGKYLEGEANNQTLNELWKALPNYVEGDNTNAIVVADVSGSMSGQPLNTSISLAIYFAERNSGPFKDYFMTFSSVSKLQKVVGNNLFEKVLNLRKAHWEQSTNIQAVFDNILKHAISTKCSNDELPSRIFIITDMEFDYCGKKTNLEGIKEQYEEAGYVLPKLVFWNVNAMQNNVPIKQDERGIFLVSGSSPSTFKYILNSNAITGVELMLDTLNNKRYENITV